MAVNMPFGAAVTRDGTRFRLWSPTAHDVTLVVEGVDHPMVSVGDGWREAVVDAPVGARYQYRVGDLAVPDPASRCQETDVHGPSVVVDPDAYDWQTADWQGRPWEEAVICEVHVGTATPEGTFDGLRRKLKHYAELGVTAIEFLPVADFAGARNWGYDGVLLFAPDRSYGSPDDLRQLIDEAHGLGLQVFIDVVYNHFGPDGNYLGVYAEDFFDPETQTPWGAALNFGQRAVRDFFIASAQVWLHEYRFDGIRFDAVHAIEGHAYKDGARAAAGEPFLEELGRTIRSGLEDGRHVHLILENDDNRAELLGGEPYDAQWNDDFHHVVHRLISGEEDGYYADYDDTHARLARVLAEGFAYQGEASAHRDGATRGTPSGGLPQTAFVSFIQNHDQVGNRAMGDRIDSVAPEDAVVAATALYLLCPHVPMIWMGEEWAASAAFPFFCDFEGDLADAVREGRRREFSAFAGFGDEAAREAIPDPNAEETFLAAKLDWQERGRGRHLARLNLFGALIALRHEHVIPLLKSGPAKPAVLLDGTAVRAVYQFPGGKLTLDWGSCTDSFGAREGETLFTTQAGAAWPFAMSVA